MKKLSFLFLALMACVAFANATVYNGICGAEGDDVIWQLNTSNGELVISGNGAMADYGFNSTPWYEYRDSITSVIIGNSITSIGDWAFSNCTGLTSVTIPNSVTSIGGYAFTSCVNLPSVNIPNNVTYIGFGVFNECHSLTSVNIPDGITDIGNNLFLNCKALPSITLPESVTSIGSQAFANCSTLVSINIPQGVTKIDRAAFAYCISLTSLTIPESVTSIGEIAFIHVENVIYSGTATGAPWGAKCMNGYSEGWLAYSDSSKSRLVACSNGATGDIIIPESVKTIDDQAFSWCSKITSVVIPQDITSIGRMVFYYCTDLLSVTIPSSVTSIGEAAFGNCNKLASVIIPDNVTSIGDYAFSNCESLTSITIPENVTSIGERAFFDCNGFTSVTCEAIEPPTLGASVFRDDFQMYEPFSITLYVPAQSVTAYQAAAGWSDFTNILPIEEEPTPCLIASGTCGAQGDNLTWELSCDSVLTISGTGAMDQYNDFEESRHAPWYDYKETFNAVKIGNGVTDIGYGAFEYHDCPNCHVSEIHFEGTIEEWCSKNWSPSNIAQHGYNLYIQNKEVTDLVIPNTITQIGDNAFQGCNSLKSVDISKGVTSIEEYAFHGCINLVSVVIPNSVTSIGERVFDECSRLTSITIPNSVTSIEISTFQNCNSLTSLEIPNSVTTIKNRAFQGSGLTSIVIPNSVTVIGEGAFYGCNLNTIVIPSSITSIEKSTFENCHNLTSVEIPISITQIGQNAFRNCNGLETVTIPTNVTNIGLQAFYKCTGLTSITCEAVTPPTLGSNVFGNVNKSIPLYVPSESIDHYKAADQWKDFNVLPIENEPEPPCLIASGTCGAEGDNLRWELSCDSVLTISGTGEMCTFDTTALPWENYTNCIVAVKIEEGVKTIGRLAFADCRNLANVTFSNTMRTIGALSFQNCTKLTTLTFPPSVIGIGLGAFDGCTGLQAVHISDLKVWSQILFGRVASPRTNPLFYAQHLYLNGVEIKNLEIPDGISEISSYAFIGGSAFTSLTIPADVAEIGDNAFSMCSGLTSITCYANTPPVLGNTVFNNVSKSIPLYVPCASFNQYKQASQWRTFTNIIPLDSIDMHIDFSVNDTLYGSVELLQKRYLSCYEQEYVLSANAKDGYQFKQWSDGNKDNPRTLTLTQDTIITAEFEPILMSSKLAMIYIKGTPVENFAPDNYSYTFKYPVGTRTEDLPTAANISWDLSDQYQTVDVSQVGTTVILNITSGRGLTKTYVLAFMVEIPNQYTVTLLSNNDNWGTVIGGNTYNANSQVGIGAFAKEGYQFYHWNNTISENPHTFTLTQDTSFVAMFLPNTEEGVVSDVTSNSVHMEWEVKPWGNHGYWVWIYADKDHKQWYCKMRFYANGVLDKFYWGPASKHYGKENSNQAAPRHFYSSPARYLEASVAIAYDLTDLDAAQDYFYTIEGVDEKEEVVSVMAGKFTTGAQTPTSIEDVTKDEDQFETAVKLIRDGQIYILCGDNIYTLQGQEVK